MTEIDVYYGTSTDIGDRIIGGGDFPVSVGNMNWLGRGIYFWVEDSSRALEWANQRAPGQAMVLRARLRPRRCLDLTQVHWAGFLRRGYSRVVERYGRVGKALPVNVGSDHALDCLVINEVCDSMGQQFDSVRGAFFEGDSIYPGSALHMRSQVQIAVRDPAIIVKRPASPFLSQIVSTEEPHG